MSSETDENQDISEEENVNLYDFIKDQEKVHSGAEVLCYNNLRIKPEIKPK